MYKTNKNRQQLEYKINTKVISNRKHSIAIKILNLHNNTYFFLGQKYRMKFHWTLEIKTGVPTRKLSKL